MPLSPLPDLLETERLRLRRQRIEDAEIYRELWTERDHRAPPHRRIDTDGHPTADDIAARIRAEQGGSGSGLLTVERVHEGDVVGYCGLLEGRDDPDEPELAYELLRRAHGAGYATEAARAVVGWAAGAGYPRLRATVRSWNAASRNVLRKVGFVEERVEPDTEFGDIVVATMLLRPRRPDADAGGLTR